jgi:hypothetical protein
MHTDSIRSLQPLKRSEKRSLKHELDLCNGLFSEETARDEGKGAKNGSGFSTVRANSKPSAQKCSRKNVTLGENSGQFSLAKMKPQLTLNTRGFEFTLKELEDNTLRAGLRDKGLDRLG